MGSEWGEFWRRILRFSSFGHQSLFDLIPTFVVPCTTGHLISVAIVCFLPYRDWSKIESKGLWRIASPSGLSHSRLRWRPRLLMRAFHAVSTRLRHLGGNAQASLRPIPPDASLRDHRHSFRNDPPFVLNTLLQGKSERGSRLEYASAGHCSRDFLISRTL